MSIAIAVDGPAGVGKSTVAKAIARELDFMYVDTGSMYRVATLLALENDLPMQAEYQDEILDLVLTHRFKFTFRGDNLLINFGQRDVTEAVRGPQVTEMVSQVSALPAIRQGLKNIQQDLAANNDVVMEGRDIGAEVLPHAEYKFYLTASPQVRAERRLRELEAKGQVLSLDSVLAGINRRDELDSLREHSPLRKAADAVEIDTSNLTIEDAVRIILAHIK